ncbi:MAG TPA: universal stress protein [Chitinophagales bacterium]|nr:universal stress protein [Chitinophagales bacterium]
MLRVLVPIDFSEGAANTLRYALQLARIISAELVIFYGNIIPMPMTDMPVVTDMPDEDAIDKKMEEEVEKAITSLKEKNEIKISYLVKPGYSLDVAINEAAEESKADLVVMGTHGATGIRKVLIGSNTVSVIATSKCPVLSVPERYEFIQPRLILVPSDLKFIEEELLDAVPFAELLGTTLEVLFFSDATEDAMKRYDVASKVIGENSYKKIKLSIEGIQFGKTIAQDIEIAVKKKEPDMLIMFRHKHNWLGNLFLTSQTDQVAFATKIPLLAFREPEK